MPKLGELARTLATKDAPADLESFEGRCWLLWRIARTEADKSSEGPLVYNDRPGIRTRLSMKAAARKLWLDIDETDLGPMRDYLRHTSNAVVVERNASARELAVWWIADEFSNELGKKTVVPRFIAAASYTEQHLTKTEAGEDRQPAPVEVRVERTSDERLTREDALDLAHEARREQGRQAMKEREDLILAALLDMPQAPTVSELLIALHMNDSQQGTIRKTLTKMVEDGTLFTRPETNEEYMARIRSLGTRGGTSGALYWYESPIPEIVRPGKKTEVKKTVTSEPTADQATFLWELERRDNQIADLVTRVKSLEDSRDDLLAQLRELREEHGERQPRDDVNDRIVAFLRQVAPLKMNSVTIAENIGVDSTKVGNRLRGMAGKRGVQSMKREGKQSSTVWWVEKE